MNVDIKSSSSGKIEVPRHHSLEEFKDTSNSKASELRSAALGALSIFRSQRVESGAEGDLSWSLLPPSCKHKHRLRLPASHFGSTSAEVK